MKALKIVTLFILFSLTAHAQKAIQVKKTGSGKPMIFLPHIGCSSDMWEQISRHYSKNYTCYLIDFAGFDTMKPIEAPFSEQYLSALNGFIKENKLKNISLVGQNYGAYIAMKIALQNPSVVSRVVVSDFYPNLGMVLDSAMTAEKLEIIKKSIVKTTLETDSLNFSHYQKQMASGMNFINTAYIAKFVEWQSNSDRQTLAGTLCEQLSDNLLPELKENKIPVLAFSTWYFARNYKKMPLSESNVTLQKMYSYMPNVTHAVTEEAKDFIAIDQPNWFVTQMDGFLKQNK